MHRLYENEDLVVFWNSEKCFHAKKCVTGSPKTFNINRKPWINLERVDNKEVGRQLKSARQEPSAVSIGIILMSNSILRTVAV